MSAITRPTAAELHAIAERALALAAAPGAPGGDAVQEHDAGEEADEEFQAGLHALAARCSACGRPLSTWQRIRRQVTPKVAR